MSQNQNHSPASVPPSAPSQLQFFVARPEQNYGPYTLPEVNNHLATGHIKATDLAWHEGATGWLPLTQIAGVVIPHIPTAPPPASYPPQQPVQPQQQPYPTQQSYPQQSYPQQSYPQQQLHPQQNSQASQAVETVVFDMTPSIMPDLIWCGLSCGLWLMALPFRYMGTLSSRYRLTTERLVITTGLLSKHSEEVEIYRVKDVTVEQGSLDRMLGIGTVTVFVNDATSPRIYLQGISQPVKVKEQIRQISRAARKAENIQSVEYLPSS